MSLPHAILTSLAERPSTGAGLARRFDRSIGYFWQATHQQIYRELGRLEAAGWVAPEVDEEAKGRERVYRLLPAGCRELRRWIAEDAAPRAVRDELMVRLRAEAVLGPSGLDAQIRRRMELEEQRLALYRAAADRDFAEGADARERRLQRLVLEAGIRSVSLRLDLYREALAILALPPPRRG